MRLSEFIAIVEDISLHTEGEGFTCNWFLENGEVIHDYAYQILQRNSEHIILLSRPDCPPIYLTPATIVAVGLCS